MRVCPLCSAKRSAQHNFVAADSELFSHSYPYSSPTSDGYRNPGRSATMSGLRLPVMPPVEPMLAKSVPRILNGALSFEPKWDGFRSIIFRDGDEVEIGSRNERPLTGYFPELVDPLRGALPERCVVDGEVVITGPAGLDFDALLQRIHPAASRIRLLAQE